jgi:predicted DsbA family dithiol-disulfide isomerase
LEAQVEHRVPGEASLTPAAGEGDWTEADSASDVPSARSIGIVSDAICPWCYIGKRQLERALPIDAREGLRFSVHWHPFQLNPDMPREGVDRANYRRAKFGSMERSEQLDRQVTEAAAAVGLTFRLDLLRRTPNTVDAHRLVWLAGQEGVQDAVMEAIFRAYFTEGADIGRLAVLADCAGASGMNSDAVLAFLRGDTLEAEVRAADRQAREAGVTGVPSFFLDGHGLFSGALPAEKMAAAFTRAEGILARHRSGQA